MCNICITEFEQQHFNQKYCCLECKKTAKKNSKEKYKTTEKGIKANQKWIKSEKRKENEKRYRQNPIAKHKAVLRAKKYLQTSEKGLAEKRKRDRVYGTSEKGKNANLLACRKYRQTDKGKINARKQKYTRRAKGKVDKEYVENLLKGKHCYYCGLIIIGKKTIDHKNPVSKNGSNENKNLVLACVHCNSQKNNKTEDEYRRWKNENNL